MAKKTKKVRRTYELLIPADAPALEAIALVEFPAIETDFITMATANRYVFARMDAQQMIAVGPAMIPNKLIPRVDELTGEEYDVFFTPETIAAVAHNFLRFGKQGSINLDHEVPVAGNSIIESWLVKDPGLDKAKALGYDMVPGTWMISMKIDDPGLWKKVISGDYRGFSIEGYFVDQLIKNKQFKEMTKIMHTHSLTVDVEMTQAILVDKTPIYTDSPDFTVGANVYSDAAMTTPMADGEYVMDNGIELDVVGGKVSDAVAEATEPADSTDGVGATDADDTNMSAEEMARRHGDYPGGFDQCVIDMTKKYGSKNIADKVCAAIKNGTVAHAAPEIPVEPKKKATPVVDLPPANQTLAMPSPEEMWAAVQDMQTRLSALETQCGGQTLMVENAAVALELANAKIAELSAVSTKKEKHGSKEKETDIEKTARALRELAERKA